MIAPAANPGAKGRACVDRLHIPNLVDPLAQGTALNSSVFNWSRVAAQAACSDQCPDLPSWAMACRATERGVRAGHGDRGRHLADSRTETVAPERLLNARCLDLSVRYDLSAAAVGGGLQLPWDRGRSVGRMGGNRKRPPEPPLWIDRTRISSFVDEVPPAEEAMRRAVNTLRYGQCPGVDQTNLALLWCSCGTP